MSLNPKFESLIVEVGSIVPDLQLRDIAWAD